MAFRTTARHSRDCGLDARGNRMLRVDDLPAFEESDRK